MATSVGCAGSTEELGVTRSRGHLAAGGQLQRQGGRRLVLHDALRRGPRGARIAVGGGVRRTQHVDRVGVAEWPAPLPGALTRSARLGPWRARTHTVGVTAVGSGTVSVRLRFTGSSGESAIAAAHRMPLGLCGAARAAEQLRAQIPLRDSRIRWRPGHHHGVAQADGMGEAVRVVLGDGEVGDAELHAGRAVVGGHGGDPHPRRLAVRQRHGQRLARLVEAQRAGAVDGRHLDAADLRADGGGARA